MWFCVSIFQLIALRRCKLSYKHCIRSSFFEHLNMASRDGLQALAIWSQLLQQKEKACRRGIAARNRIRARRRITYLLAITAALVILTEVVVPNPRSIWAAPRSSQWWEQVVLDNFGPHDWMENFRMSRHTFQYLCNQLRSVIQKQDTRMRTSVSVERRVAILHSGF